MAKWTTSFFLILTLGAGALSGMPLHSNDEKCMHGMSGMDCCKTAQGQGNQKEVASARVCCAVNCPQSGTKGSSSIRVPNPSSMLSAALYAVVQVAVPKAVPLSPWRRSHGPPPGSNPAYIRNLALLI
jgi:hypothetical protein